MKFLAIVFAFVFSAQVFAATPYTFNCLYSGDTCTISEVTEMEEVEKGVYAGVEGNYELYFEKKTCTMYVYLGDDMLSLSIGGTTLAHLNEAKNGLVGIVLLDDEESGKGLKISRSAIK